MNDYSSQRTARILTRVKSWMAGVPKRSPISPGGPVLETQKFEARIENTQYQKEDVEALKSSTPSVSPITRGNTVSSRNTLARPPTLVPRARSKSNSEVSERKEPQGEHEADSDEVFVHRAPIKKRASTVTARKKLPRTERAVDSEEQKNLMLQAFGYL
jgi:hypothetical protein